MAKITQKQSECISCGSCEAVCPKFWKINENTMKADLLGAKFDDAEGVYVLEADLSEEDLKCLKESEDVCPVRIIAVK